MKQSRLDKFFKIKKINQSSTPYNTPNYGSINNSSIIDKISLDSKLKNLENISNTILDKYVLRFDGASKGNPGEAGAGAVIYKNNNEIWSISQNLGKKTNNYAECFALTLGIIEASKRNIKNLQVEGDSLLVINHLKGKWAVKNQNLKDLYLSISLILEQFDKITYKHIYRNLNTRADELANIGVNKI